MHSRYDPALVALSILVAIAAAYVALDLAGRVAASRGRWRAAWLVGGTLALAMGIWSMHFIGMLAFRLHAGDGGVAGAPLPMRYDVPRLALSMVVALCASLIALYPAGVERVTRLHLALAGATLGAAIAGMHYVGMAGLHVPAQVSHDPVRVVLSVVVALLASYLALVLARRLRTQESGRGLLRRGAAAVVIGVGIASVHYTAISAARFHGYDPGRTFTRGAVLATEGLGWTVTGATLVILSLALLGTAVDRALRSRQELMERLEATNAELQRAVVTAEEASEAKSVFLATMSHELRTPLNAFAGYLQLMEMEVAGPITPRQKEYLMRMQASNRHLTGLINDVLDLAKIESGQLVVRSGDVNLSAVMDAAVSLMRPQIEGAGLHVAEQCAIDQEASFTGDEDRVRQILVNLVSNAVKFNAPGGSIALDCGVTATPDPGATLPGPGRWAFVRVRDTGPGIPADQREAIFEAFTQLDSSHARRAGGTGLGLTISRRLARQMGGDLTVRSTLGTGSEFTLWLRAASPGERPPSAADQLLGQATPLQPARMRGLGAVGDTLIRLTPEIMARFSARLRADGSFPGAATLNLSQLTDHITALLADIAAALLSLEEQGGTPSIHLVDSTDIQRFIAELHGVQRERLGWDEATVHREHELLRDELRKALRAAPVGSSERDTAERIVIRFIEQAEETSIKALHASQGRETMRQPRSEGVTEDPGGPW